MAQRVAHVLVVDDDSMFRTMVAEFLVERGYAAEPFGDPREALERARSSPFDAAIVDLQMPQMGGLELAERLQEASPDTQVIVLTGHAGIDTAIEGIQRGVFDYLLKASIDLGRLEGSLRAAVNRGRLLCENRELQARERESNRLLAELQAAATALAAEPRLDRLLERLVRTARDLCRAQAGRALLFRRGSSGDLVVDTAVGDDASTLQGTRLHADEGIASLALREDRAQAIALARDHTSYSARCDEFPAHLRAMLCAPLRHGTIEGVIALAAQDEFPPEHAGILTALARQGAVAIENALHHDNALNFFTHTSELLVSMLEEMDLHYAGHSRRVALFCDMLTRRLGMSDVERRNVHFGALLHDIGKVRMGPALLNAASYPSEPERLRLQEHSTLGMEMLRPITEWADILPIVHAHHERWDGAGYPRGLAGDEIPIGARVVAVADAFDAMTRQKPHGTRRTSDEALAELKAFSGSQFDPRIVRLFIAEYALRGEP